MKTLKKNIIEVFITVGLLFLVYNISVIPTQNTSTQASKIVSGNNQVNIASQNPAALRNE